MRCARSELGNPSSQDQRQISPRTFNPHCALLHPLWWLSLVLLTLNDHYLKFAGLLPTWLTGKLSDFAGLLVAPLLLVALLGLRSTAARLGAFALVAALFSALQLSPALANGLTQAAGHWGLHLAIWPDPTDLIALPILGLAWHLSRRSPDQLSHLWKRAVAAIAIGLGAAACIATSALPAPHYPVTGKADMMMGDVILLNQTDSAVGVHIAMLSDRVDLDCETTASNPPHYLRKDLFTENGLWTQLPGEAAAIWPIGARSNRTERRGCYAMLLSVDSSATTLVFWQADKVPVQAQPIRPEAGEPLSHAIILTQSDGRFIFDLVGNVQVYQWSTP